MSADIITHVSASMGGGFFGGILLGYATKKVVKIIAVIALEGVQMVELALILQLI